MGKISRELQAAATLELIRRKRAKALESSLHQFIEYFFPIMEGVDFIFKEHHSLIIDELEAVYAGDINRLIINIPPGYGKTELVVVLFSAWCLAKEPRSRS